MTKLITRYGVCNTDAANDCDIVRGGVYEVLTLATAHHVLIEYVHKIVAPKEWFDLLPSWFHKVLEDNPDMTVERLYKEFKPCLSIEGYKDRESLAAAFRWSQSPQGFDFWSSLDAGTWEEKPKLAELELAQAEAEELRLKNGDLNKLLNELSVSLISEQEEKVVLKEQVKKLTMKLSDIEKRYTKMSLSIINLQGSISNFNKEALYVLD